MSNLTLNQITLVKSSKFPLIFREVENLDRLIGFSGLERVRISYKNSNGCWRCCNRAGTARQFFNVNTWIGGCNRHNLSLKLDGVDRAFTNVALCESEINWLGLLQMPASHLVCPLHH